MRSSALMFFEGLLGEAVEGKCGDGAFEMRAVMPQVQWEQHQPVKRAFGNRARARRAEHINASSAEGELLPAGEYFYTESARN
jgi:hypothetical protein